VATHRMTENTYAGRVHRNIDLDNLTQLLYV
jgi:hypothetical protein